MTNHIFRIKDTYFELLDNYTLDIIFDMCDYLSEHKNNFCESHVHLKYQFGYIISDLRNKCLRNPRYKSLIPKYNSMGGFDPYLYLLYERQRLKKHLV